MSVACSFDKDDLNDVDSNTYCNELFCNNILTDNFNVSDGKYIRVTNTITASGTLIWHYKYYN